MRLLLLTIALFAAGCGEEPPTAPPAPPAAADGPTLFARKVGGLSCADCHSHETVWGWHTRIAPVSWLAVHDVNEGRRELDFSRWGLGRRWDRVGAKIAEQVREGDMPPLLYVLAHPEAKLTDADRAALEAWSATLPGGGAEPRRLGRR